MLDQPDRASGAVRQAVRILKDYERQKKLGLDPVFEPADCGIKKCGALDFHRKGEVRGSSRAEAPGRGQSGKRGLTFRIERRKRAQSRMRPLLSSYEAKGRVKLKCEQLLIEGQPSGQYGFVKVKGVGVERRAGAQPQKEEKDGGSGCRSRRSPSLVMDGSGSCWTQPGRAAVT